jgi:hypothetical protein
MKRFVFAIAALFALGWSTSAFAQATSIATTCPTNFTCAFSAAESMSLVTLAPNREGQPDVFVGYMEFDGSSNVTLTGLQNIDGKISPIGAAPSSGAPFLLSGPCTNGANGQPATISLSDNSAISFVLDSSASELQFILTKDPKTAANSTAANSVRVGVCRKQ